MVLPPTRQVLFNPGPVNLDRAVRENLFNVELCHRQPEFEELLCRVRSGLFPAAGFSRSSHRLSLLHGSGTLAVDAALTSLVRGKVLVVRNGYYCDRIATSLRQVGTTSVRTHDLGLGGRVDLDALACDVDAFEPDWVAVVHHETSTGLLNPLAQIAELAKDRGSKVFVDAVSSLGAHPVPREADVVCFNSSKCLESLPGIAGVFWAADLASRAPVPVLDVGAYADGIPSTPNVQAFVALDIALELLAGEDRPERYRRLSTRVRATGGEAFDLLLPTEDRSNVVTAFRLGGRTFKELRDRALARGYVIYPGQKDLETQIFRVANMGAIIDELVIDDLFATLAA